VIDPLISCFEKLGEQFPALMFQLCYLFVLVSVTYSTVMENRIPCVVQLEIFVCTFV